MLLVGGLYTQMSFCLFKIFMIHSFSCHLNGLPKSFYMCTICLSNHVSHMFLNPERHKRF